MKTIMILGASYTQLPLFAAAKRLGCRTIAASIPGDYPCFAKADASAYVNIADPEAVAAAAKEHQADGIVTCGLDLGMRALGAAAESCGIPGPSAEAALRASNKYLMKQAFMENGVRTAKFFRVSSETELETAAGQLTFPVLLKAVDQMGSRGIFYCATEAEARRNLPEALAATQKDYCLIEEFIQGELFGVEAMVQNGKILFMLPNNSESTKTKVQSPVGHSYPIHDREEIAEDLERQVTGAIRALGLDNCPVNCDCMRNGDKVYLIEMTGRSGATGLSEMTSQYLGIDYYELIIRLALGEDLTPYFSGLHAESEEGVTSGFPAVRPAPACRTHTLMAGGTGIVKEIINENPPAYDIIDLSFNICPGDEIHPYTNGRDRIGQVFLTGPTLQACSERLEEILAHLHIVLEDGTEVSCL